MQNNIDSQLFRKMFLAGSKYLEAKKDFVNNLNVFPVPDGDTGTNMLLTLTQAAKGLAALPDTATLSEMGGVIATGTLRGARGNSGVILSQLCRGFCKGIEGVVEIDKLTVSKAMNKAVLAAYKAVMQPQEGTILTVAKETAEKAAQLVNSDMSMEDYFLAINAQAKETLKKTPELLPVLKEAGVVDSGGQGLVEFLDGALDAFLGKEIDFSSYEGSQPEVYASGYIDSSDITTADIKFGYCTEFIVDLKDNITYKHEQEFKEYLSSIGDSIVCVRVDDVAKVHVHTNHPGLAIEKALEYGSLSNLKIDNMRIEHRQKVIKEAEMAASKEAKAKEPKKENGFISVCTGEGLAEIFRGLNVDKIIDGGQTMNPSASDFIDAIKEINAENVFILPNNGNIILTAKQAKNMVEGVNVNVIPTKTICQGINAMIGFVPSLDAEGNVESMTECASDVKTGEVTYAVRDTSIKGKKIENGDYMGIGDGEILSVSKDRVDAAVKLAVELAGDEAEIISLYYGADTEEDEAQEVADKISEALADVEVEVAFGGQSVYNYLISVE